jgi:hypothetical protein
MASFPFGVIFEVLVACRCSSIIDLKEILVDWLVRTRPRARLTAQLGDTGLVEKHSSGVSELFVIFFLRDRRVHCLDGFFWRILWALNVTSSE